MIELDPVLPEGSQRLYAALDPTGNSLAAGSSQISQDAPVYLCAYDFAPPRELAVDTYQVCAAAQTLSQLPEIANDEDAALEQFSRVGTLYSAKLMQHLSRLQKQLQDLQESDVGEMDEERAAEVDDKRAQLTEKQQHWTAVFEVFSLVQVLYFPSLETSTPESPLPVVGEQLLHFINTVDPQPSREDGLHLASLGTPYNEELFWSYLPRCILRGLYKAASTLAASMHDNPLPFVRHAATLLCALLDRMPKASMFSTSYEHLRACHTFRMDVQRAITELTDQYEDVARWTVEAPPGSSRKSPNSRLADQETRETWLARLMLLLRLIKGDETVVLQSCDNWKEALAAWAMLIRPTMTRDDIPDTVQKIWQGLPIDPDLPGEEAQESFILGNAALALSQCDELSSWLSTHLADLLDKLGALEAASGSDPFEETQESHSHIPTGSAARDWYLLRWADQLQGDEGLWRIALHYLSFVGSPEQTSAYLEAAEERMKAILRHVKWQDPTLPASSVAVKLSNGDANGEKESAAEKAETQVEDVLKTCYEYGFEDVAIQLCQAAAEKLITVRDYGRAAAFIVQAGDTQRMARLTDLLIDEYILRGATEFARLVDAFPTRLLRPDAAINKSFFQSLAPSAQNGDLNGAMEDDTNTHPEENEFGAPAATGAHMHLFHDWVSFLARYRDMHAFMANEQKMEAAKTIVGLLRSGVVSKRFVAVLLLDALSLLEDESEIFFDQQDTFELMRCLDATETKAATEGSVLKPVITLVGKDNWPKVSQALRLSLTKNLSRCFCLTLV